MHPSTRPLQSWWETQLCCTRSSRSRKEGRHEGRKETTFRLTLTIIVLYFHKIYILLSEKKWSQHNQQQIALNHTTSIASALPTRITASKRLWGADQSHFPTHVIHTLLLLATPRAPKYTLSWLHTSLLMQPLNRSRIVFSVSHPSTPSTFALLVLPGVWLVSCHSLRPAYTAHSHALSPRHGHGVSVEANHLLYEVRKCCTRAPRCVHKSNVQQSPS